MKSNELMIGDWVNCITDKTNIKISRLNTIDTFIGDADNYADEEDKLNLLSDVGGIPLTKELLELNGFEYKRACYDNGCIVIDTDYFGELPYSIIIGKRSVVINYVHELQHALRLCGLNKLADNFKLN